MKLRTVILNNFRGYRSKTNIPIDDFTALVGKNDVGKSTILEALDTFFDGGVVKIDASDASVGSSSTVVTIGCEFEVPPMDLVIDATAHTTLPGEYLLNRQGHLEVHKSYEVGGAKPKSPKVFAMANHPSQKGLNNLLGLKLAALKQMVSSAGMKTDDVDLTSKPSMRKALWASGTDLQLEERLVSLDEEGGGEVWEKLKESLPLYALFRADRSMTDDDSEVQDPMKLAVAEAVKSVEEELNSIRDKVRESAVALATRTVEKLRSFDEALAQALNPVFKTEPKWDGFKMSLDDERGIPINKRGSGFRRLILLSFFQAEAERRRGSERSVGVIYGIEEPEASQHPNNQRLVAKALLELSRSPGRQVIISTHNPALADLVPVESLRLISAAEGGAPDVRFGTSDVIEEACESLGVLPDPLGLKVLLHVEGPTDVDFFERASHLYASAGEAVVDLTTSDEVRAIPIGGGTLRQWVTHKYLRGGGRIEVHVYDRGSDTPPQYQTDVNEVNARGNQDLAYLTTRREIENYFPTRLVRAVFGGECPEYGPDANVPELLAKRVHEADASPEKRPWAELPPEAIRKKESAVKRRLNIEGLPQMMLDDLRAADANGEILGWLRAVRERVT